jgi:hypothetical protein
MLAEHIAGKSQAQEEKKHQDTKAQSFFLAPCSLAVFLAGWKACATAVRGLRSPFVYSFPHSLTVCSPLAGWKARDTAVHGLRSPFVYSFPIR